MARLTTNIVPPAGPTNAKIYFFGEAPGETEDRGLEPFIGDAGWLLNRCFKQTGIVRSDILLHNCFRQRPPHNDVGYFFQDKNQTILTWEGEEHIELLRHWLHERLRERDAGSGGPNLLVALGAVALKILTGKRRINKWRGSVLPCTLVPGFKVYPTYHPSYVNRLINEVEEEQHQSQQKKIKENVLPLFLIDLQRVVQQADFPEIRTPQRRFDLNLTFGEIIARLEKLAEMEGMVGVDIETLPGRTGPVVWMIGFAPTPEYAFNIPFLRDQRFAWTLEEFTHILRGISNVFLNTKLLKIFQGGSYDLSVLGRYYGLRVAKGTYADTMLCHHANYPYLRKGLEVLASIYTWEPYYKDEGKLHLGTRNTHEGEAAYNCKDAAVTREIYPVTLRDAREMDFIGGYYRTISVFPSHLGMMLRGIRVDMKKKDQLGQEFNKRADVAQEKVNRLVGRELNLNSVADKSLLLYSYLGLPIQYHVKTRKPTVDRSALQRLLRKQPTGSEAHSILSEIIEYQKYSKLASTYTNMQVDCDGRIHTTYGWVSTWRTSSKESPFGGGGNLQNIPRSGTTEGKLIRSLFVPDPGKILVAADLSQAEARVVAWEANDLGAIEFFLAKKDIHWKKCRELFRIHPSVEYEPKILFADCYTGEQHSLKELRYLAKRVVHAGNYGMGPRLLQTILLLDGFELEYKTCCDLMHAFQMTEHFTMEWQRRIRETVREKRELVSSLGRRRRFLGRVNDSLFRSAYAFSPQSTVGELLQLSIQDIWENVPFAEILLNVHDEVVCQIEPKDLDRAIVEIKKRMERTITINERPLTIPADFKVGPSWGEMEEVK